MLPIGLPITSSEGHRLFLRVSFSTIRNTAFDRESPRQLQTSLRAKLTVFEGEMVFLAMYNYLTLFSLSQDIWTGRGDSLGAIPLFPLPSGLDVAFSLLVSGSRTREGALVSRYSEAQGRPPFCAISLPGLVAGKWDYICE